MSATTTESAGGVTAGRSSERSYSGNRVGVRQDGDWTILHVRSGGAETTTSIREHEAWDLATRLSPALSKAYQERCAEVGQMRDALHELSPACAGGNADNLRETAEEIDCGGSCRHSFYDASCNAHECSREGTDEGCAFQRAESLRNLAAALETHAALSANPGAAGRDGGEWVLMPREPTISMLARLCEVAWPGLSTANRERPLREGYRAMVAAAQRPAPAQPPEGGGGDLEPCPFCGCDDVAMHPNDIAKGVGRLMATPGTAQYAHCDGCGAEGPQSLNSEREAAEAWNQRAGRLVPAPPSAAPGGSDRERVAEALWRSDNPGEDDLGWREWCAYVAKCNNPPALTREIKACLRRADAILALTPQPASPGAGERVRHVQSGIEYEVLGEAEVQVSTGTVRTTMLGKPLGGVYRRIANGSGLTVYRCLKTGKLWCRLTDEFRDGRFVTVASAEPTAPDAAGADVEKPPFRTGDIVLHGPSNETWTIAYADPVSGDIAWCGWPEGLARLADCTLVAAATDDQHLGTLRAVIQAGGIRARGARRIHGEPPSPGSGDADAGGRS